MWQHYCLAKRAYKVAKLASCANQRMPAMDTACQRDICTQTIYRTTTIRRQNDHHAAQQLIRASSNLRSQVRRQYDRGKARAYEPSVEIKHLII